MQILYGKRDIIEVTTEIAHYIHSCFVQQHITK